MFFPLLVFPVLLFVLSAVYADPLFQTFPISLCSTIADANFRGEPLVDCKNPHTILGFRLITALLVSSVYFLVYATYAAVQRWRSDLFQAPARELNNCYFVMEDSVDFLSKKAFDEQRIRNILQRIHAILSHHIGAGNIAFSLFLVDEYGAPNNREIRMVQKLYVDRIGQCARPPSPISFRYGEGFVGLAWRHRQIRLGQRKYLGIFRNKAYKNIDTQNDKQLNSFFCIPVFLDGEDTIVAILSIDSSISGHFGLLSSSHKTYLDLGQFISKIFGLYTLRVFGIREDLVDKLRSIAK